MTLSPGGRNLVEIEVARIPPSGLAAFQFDIRFNPAVLSVVNPNEAFRGEIAPFAPLGGIGDPICAIVRGASTCPDPIWFLTSTGRTPIGTDLIDNDHGIVQVAYATFGTTAPPGGSGIIALIEVAAKTADPAFLSFENALLADAEEPPMRFPVSTEPATINGSIGGSADVNCDAHISAADVPALLQLLRSGTPSSCSLGDVNQDGAVGEADIEALIQALFIAYDR